MSLIRLNDVSMEFDGRPVLREAFLKLRRGDRIGLIGKNGTGKTTFLELVLGRREPTGGTVDVTLGTTIGYFSQFSELDGEQSTHETLSAHFAAVHETQARLDEIGAQLAEPMTDAAMTAPARRAGRAVRAHGPRRRLDVREHHRHGAHEPRLRRGAAAPARRPAVGRMAQPGRARADPRAGARRAAARRADELPRPRRRALDRGLARRLRRRGARGLARPPVPRRGRRPHRRDRELPAAGVRGQLLGVRAREAVAAEDARAPVRARGGAAGLRAGGVDRAPRGGPQPVERGRAPARRHQEAAGAAPDRPDHHRDLRRAAGQQRPAHGRRG